MQQSLCFRFRTPKSHAVPWQNRQHLISSATSSSNSTDFSSSSILFVQSTCLTDCPFPQPLSRSSLVFLLDLDALLRTPCISSPNHRLLFAAHAHTNAACSAVIPMVCHLYLICLSGPYLEICIFNLTPHIHMTILVSTR